MYAPAGIVPLATRTGKGLANTTQGTDPVHTAPDSVHNAEGAQVLILLDLQMLILQVSIRILLLHTHHEWVLTLLQWKRVLVLPLQQ